jgi:hypothetical protein
MEVPMTAFLVALALFAQQSDSSLAESPGLKWGFLFHTTGSADIRQGLKTLNADTLTVFPSALFSKEWVHLGAVASLDYTPDSTIFSLRPVSAGAYFRWPGSPWVATGISRGEINPFLAGINVPVREWNSYAIADTTAVTIEAGGLLGFDGHWNQIGDSLSWYGVDSPWLGFGIIEWNRIVQSSSITDAISGFLDLRKAQPWFLFVQENSKWSYLTEIRGLNPLRNSSMAVEVVPRLYITEDSSTVELLGYLRSESSSISGSIGAFMDLENDSEISLSAGMEMLSQAGIAWSFQGELDRLRDFCGRLSGFSRMSPAGCGGAVEMSEDSIRVTATGLYSPVAGVSADLSVMSDLSTDSPDPGCLLRVFGARQNCTAAVILIWEEGSTSLGMEVSAWLD